MLPPMRSLRIFALALFASFLLGGCTPQTGLMMAALPEGTTSALLGHLQRVEDVNRRRIVEFEQRKDWNGLAAFAEENLQRDPYTADWWIVAGYAYTNLGQYDRARRCYSEVIRMAPDDTLGWGLLANSYRATGEVRQALATLDRALLALPDDSRLLYLLGETYAQTERWSDAARAYERALKTDPGSAPAWYGLGLAYASLGQNDRARDAVRALEKLDPQAAQKLRARLESRP